MKVNYDLMLKGTVGYWDFNQDQVDYILGRNKDNEVHVLIDSLGGMLNEGLSISSAFADHGNVHVHYRGFNASAATVASMGAKHVTMDRTAMYLVHKCSYMVFEWAQLNSDALRAKIEQYAKSASELEKLDAVMAQMYARRCKKTDAELLDLMKEERWLTAEEALDWGFIDEIVEAGESVKLKASVASAMANAGMPVPHNVTIEADGFFESLQAMMQKFAEKITGKKNVGTSAEDNQDGPRANDTKGAPVQHGAPVAAATAAPAQNTNPINQSPMKKIFNFIAVALACAAAEFEANAEGMFAMSEEQMDKLEGALAKADADKKASDTAKAELEAKVAELTAKVAEHEATIAQKDAAIAELEKKPADEPSHQVLDAGGHAAEQPVDDSWATARKMFKGE